MTSIDNLIANTIREDVRAGHIYNVPDSSGYIKLDAMENPYQLPDALRAELAQRLADAVLNRYPVPSYAGIKERVRAKLGVPAGFDVILGNGSDEIISILCTACSRQDKRAVVLAPTTASTFTVPARTGGTYLIERVGASALPFAPVTGTPATASRQLGPVTIGLPGS